MTPAQLEVVASLFAVLSEPSRLRILRHLQDGPASVGEVVDALDLKQANASKQLGLLHDAGVLAREQHGLRVIYSIAMPLVFDLCELVCGGVAEQAEARAKVLKAKR